ncbi:MAG: capsule assembly Wzi family protein, partial [Balneolales bacterium]|nr:capsule assembly Wzi family protein [Balneolales bacterium]
SSQLSGSQTLDAFTATPMPLTRVFAIHPEHREQLHPSNARELGGLLLPESLRAAMHRNTLGRIGFVREHRDDPGAAYWLREFARPEVYLLPFTSIGQYNSDRVWSPNSGPAWSGRGYSHAATGGISARWLVFDLQLAPVWTAAENRSFDTARDLLFGTARSTWISAQGNFDTPIRLDSSAVNRWYWGETWAKVMLGPLTAGVSNQNLWWGPGRRHSVLMTNNAPGFQHATLHTNRPLNIGAGNLQFQYVAGRLERSYYNESAYSDDWRFLTALVVDFEPRFAPGLHLGMVRAFHLRASDLKSRSDYFPLFQPFQKSRLAPGETSLQDGSAPDDQRASVYFSWHFPESEVTFYGEYGRTDHAADIRDFYLQPNHARAYMLGVHKTWSSSGSRALASRHHHTASRSKPSRSRGGQSEAASTTRHRTPSTGHRSTLSASHPPVWSLSAEIMDASNTMPSRVRLWRQDQRPNDLRFYNHGSVRHGYSHLGRGMGSPVGLAGTAWFLALQRTNGIWDAGIMVEFLRKNRVTYLRLLESDYQDARQELELTAGGYIRRDMFNRKIEVQLSSYLVQARNQHYIRLARNPVTGEAAQSADGSLLVDDLHYRNPLNLHVRLTLRYRLFPGIVTR